MKRPLIGIVLLLLMVSTVFPQDFVTAKDGKLFADGKPYYFVGANYWYGSLLGLQQDKKRGVERLTQFRAVFRIGLKINYK